MSRGNIIKTFSIEGKLCEIVLENPEDYKSDYYRYALYDNGKRKFGVRKMKRGTQDEGFVNNMILSYEMEKGAIPGGTINDW